MDSWNDDEMDEALERWTLEHTRACDIDGLDFIGTFHMTWLYPEQMRTLVAAQGE